MPEIKQFNTLKKDKKGKKDYELLSERYIQHYNENILNYKEYIDALQYYKGNGYSSINSLLFSKKMNIESKNILEVICSKYTEAIQNDSNQKTALKKVMNTINLSLFNTNVVPVLEKIKTLDEIFMNAPTLDHDDIIVYRGVTTDIHYVLECKQGTYFVTFPNYLSTSFVPTVSKGFAGEQGVIFTIHLTKECKGLYINWDLNQGRDFEDMYVDNEYEYILPRGCKFEVVKIEPVRISNINYRTYGELKCLNKHNLFIKHYILKLVKQPNIDDLKSSLKKMYNESRFDVNTNLLKNVKIEPEKDKRRKS